MVFEKKHCNEKGSILFFTHYHEHFGPVATHIKLQSHTQNNKSDLAYDKIAC